MLILGVGNEFRGDDAAGLIVARRLREKLPELRIAESDGNLADLIDCFATEDEVIVIDAVCSGRAAGAVHRLDPLGEVLPSACFRGSTHAFGIAEAVELCRTLGRLPGRIVIYGIEGTNFAIGGVMSPGVTRAVQRVVAQIADEVAAYA